VENVVAVSNSGRVRSLPKICEQLFRSIARARFYRWHIVATQKQILLDKKFEPRCGIHTRSPRLRAWLLLPAAEILVLGETKNSQAAQRN